ncbi:hypothetical protein [Streptomyces sp. NPDC052701]|uniref:hypothetical protein n=1 Tax=Streptomyces sp. NPDC052701 TaxID=3155533 RepID=UPI00341E8753
MHDDSNAAHTSAFRRLASWLRRRGRPRPSPGTPPERPAAQAPPSRLRPQPEDDASVYPLF